MNLADIDRADRLVVIDFEGTGNRPKVRIEMIRSPRSVRLPGVIIEIGAVELLRLTAGEKARASTARSTQRDR